MGIQGSCRDIVGLYGFRRCRHKRHLGVMSGYQGVIWLKEM